MNIDELRIKYRDDILHIADEYDVSNIRVFGSTVRGDARDDSDVDLLVTLNKPLGFAFCSLQRRLSELLNKRVDLLSDNGLSPYIGPYILEEAVEI